MSLKEPKRPGKAPLAFPRAETERSGDAGLLLPPQKGQPGMRRPETITADKPSVPPLTPQHPLSQHLKAESSENANAAGRAHLA